MARILKLGILLGCDGYGCDTHAPIYTRHHILQFINYECRDGVRCGSWNSTHLYQHSLVLLARNIPRKVAGKEPSLGDMAYPKKKLFRSNSQDCNQNNRTIWILTKRKDKRKTI